MRRRFSAKRLVVHFAVVQPEVGLQPRERILLVRGDKQLVSLVDRPSLVHRGDHRAVQAVALGAARARLLDLRAPVKRNHHQICALIRIVDEDLDVFPADGRERLVLRPDSLDHRPAQPVAHHVRVKAHRQQDDLVRLPQPRHVLRNFLVPVLGSRKFHLVAVLVQPDERCVAAQVGARVRFKPFAVSKGEVQRRRRVLGRDFLRRVQRENRQPRENHVRIAVCLVRIGENLIDIALPNRVRAGVVGVIVNKAEG